MGRVAVYGTLVIATIGAGLLLRFAPLGLPALVVKYGGSTMWALTIYWVLAVLLARWQPWRVLVVAGVIATAVEFFKLYRSPEVDVFRLTLPGILLLGRYFSVWDIAAYWVAIGVGGLVDASAIRSRRKGVLQKFVS